MGEAQFVKDIDAAAKLAELILGMSFISAEGQKARSLARQVFGFRDPLNEHRRDVAITTNGTTRFIPEDEPVFLIRGQDEVGGNAVRAWADMAEKVGAAPDILATARVHAAKMDAWPKKKVADLPKGDRA